MEVEDVINITLREAKKKFTVTLPQDDHNMSIIGLK